MLSIDHFRRSIAWSEIWIPVDSDEQQPTSIALSIVTVKKFLDSICRRLYKFTKGFHQCTMDTSHCCIERRIIPRRKAIFRDVALLSIGQRRYNGIMPRRHRKIAKGPVPEIIAQIEIRRDDIHSRHDQRSPFCRACYWNSVEPACDRRIAPAVTKNYLASKPIGKGMPYKVVIRIMPLQDEYGLGEFAVPMVEEIRRDEISGVLGKIDYLQRRIDVHEILLQANRPDVVAGSAGAAEGRVAEHNDGDPARIQCASDFLGETA